MGDLEVRIRHGGGGSDGAAVALLALFVAAALIYRARHAISTAGHVIVTVLVVAGWTLAGAAAVTGAALTGVRIRRALRARCARRAAVLAPRPVITITAERYTHPTTAPTDRPALERPRPERSWPLPGWWEEIRPRIGGDSDEHRPR